MDLLEKVHASLIRPKFDFLANMEPITVAQILSDEHPQTIAIVLAHLEPRAAARILVMLEPEKQVDIARRIATTDQTTPEAIDLVEAGIQKRMTTEVQESAKVGGKKPLAQVLNSVDRTTEKEILGKLGAQDPQLAEDVRRFMFTFEDILLLTDRDMQTLMKTVDQKVLALALRDKHIPQELKDKFFKNMSSRAAEMLREEMSLGGQVRQKNVEDAQGTIVNEVKRLEDAEEIIINRGGEDAF
jgi:flagellar motor switch protein FliG